MLKAVIWDFDGTLCDTYPAIVRAVNAALEQFGSSASPEQIIEMTSVSLDHCIRMLAAAQYIDYDALDAMFAETYRQIQPSEQPAFPGVHTALEQFLASGVQNFIVTHRRQASLAVLLATHGLTAYFTAIIAADAGFPRKPAPDSIVHLLRTHSIAPAEALVIGDRELDIGAGQAAGCATCLFGDAPCALTPTYRIASFAALNEVLAGTSHMP